jgi:hypothetical protein
MKIMTTVVMTVKLSAAAGVIAVGSAAVGDAVLGPDTHIPLSVMVAVVSVGVTSAFAIARMVTRWEDKLAMFERRLDAMPCNKTSECPKESERFKSDTRHFKKPHP